MRGYRDRLLGGAPAPPDGEGFAGLPSDFRDSAEQFCFFCEGLGLAIAAGLVPENLIISLMVTQIVEVWRVMEPYIMDDRDYRARKSGDCIMMDHVMTGPYSAAWHTNGFRFQSIEWRRTELVYLT